MFVLSTIDSKGDTTIKTMTGGSGLINVSVEIGSINIGSDIGRPSSSSMTAATMAVVGTAGVVGTVVHVVSLNHLPIEQSEPC
jgi:hypothetical protein